MWFNNYNFDALDRRLRKASSVNLDSVTFARGRENRFIYIIIVLSIADLVHYFVSKYINVHLGFILMFLVIYIGSIIVLVKQNGFGISYKTFIYVKYSLVLHRELKVEEIPIEKVHYVDVKNRLLLTTVRIKYINEKGKISEMYFAMPKFIIGYYRYRFKNNRNDICKKLTDLQKVLDKGDF